MKRWLLCGVFFLMTAAFTCLGMLQLEGAASCLPEGIFYADTSEAVRQPVAEETLDSPWIASYVREACCSLPRWPLVGKRSSWRFPCWALALGSWSSPPGMLQPCSAS